MTHLKTKDPDYYKKYYQANREKKLAATRAWAEKNRDKVRIYGRRASAKSVAVGKSKETTRQWEIRNKEWQLFKAAKIRAAKAELPFDIEPTDIIIPDVCPILGIPIIRDARGKAVKGSPSLDKVNPELGYVKGNVWVVSWLANQMKAHATKEELLAFAHGVLRVFGEAARRKNSTTDNKGGA